MTRRPSATNRKRVLAFFYHFHLGIFKAQQGSEKKFTAHSFFLDAIDHAHSIHDTQFPQRLYTSKHKHAILSILNPIVLILQLTHSLLQTLLLLIDSTYWAWSLQCTMHHVLSRSISSSG
jgi:hypothetical protein